jgi:hypothetical protein
MFLYPEQSEGLPWAGSQQCGDFGTKGTGAQWGGGHPGNAILPNGVPRVPCIVRPARA